MDEIIDWLLEWVEYFRANPTIATGAAAAAIVVLFFLFRKPKVVREADRQLNRMRSDRPNDYNQLRPPH